MTNHDRSKQQDNHSRFLRVGNYVVTYGNGSAVILGFVLALTGLAIPLVPAILGVMIIGGTAGFFIAMNEEKSYTSESVQDDLA